MPIALETDKQDEEVRFKSSPKEPNRLDRWLCPHTESRRLRPNSGGVKHELRVWEEFKFSYVLSFGATGEKMLHKV